MFQIRNVGFRDLYLFLQFFFLFFSLLFLLQGKKKRMKKQSVDFICVCAQCCVTLCNTMDCSLPGSSVHGNSQARKLEWVAISFSRGSSRPQEWNPCRLCLLHWQADSLTLHYLYSWGVKRKEITLLSLF